MDFKTLQTKVIETAMDYGKKYNIKIDEQFAILKLFEEVGELAQASLIHKKMSRPEKHVEEHISKNELAKEISDVVGLAIVYAHLLDIDLEDAIIKKWVNRMHHIDELRSLNLPFGEYAIFGSGPMAIRKIRDSHDIDIIVKNDLWETLSKKHKDHLHQNPTCLKIGSIEIFKDWRTLTDKIDEMIDSAETIHNYPFVQLKYVIEWKRQFGREKDLKDIELIREYMEKK
jgi:NTP pyrophosphatase (non-canonical NTP hydrolase)